MDASSDLHYHQIVEKVKNTKKKPRKVKKKAPQSNVVQMEPLANLPEYQIQSQPDRPESRVFSGQHNHENPRAQFHLRNYSAENREDYNFDSLSLETASKLATADRERKPFVSSPPPSSDRKQASGRPNYTPYSPARVLVQPASSNLIGYGKNKSSHSPTEVTIALFYSYLCNLKISQPLQSYRVHQAVISVNIW